MMVRTSGTADFERESSVSGPYKREKFYNRIISRGVEHRRDMGRPSDARERLIEAAKSVIFAQSYEGVSVDELCVAAGVTRSSFYHFFSSKQELVLEAIESQWLWFEQ